MQKWKYGVGAHKGGIPPGSNSKPSLSKKYYEGSNYKKNRFTGYRNISVENLKIFNF